MRPTRTLLLAVLLGAPLAVACDRDRREWEARYDQQLADVNHHVDEIPIPEVTTDAPLGSVPAHVARVLVTLRLVELDVSPLSSSRAYPEHASDARRNAALPATPRTLLHLAQGAIPTGAPVVFSLDEAVLPRAAVRDVSVVADGAVPATTVLRVIERLAADAGTEHAWLHVRTDRGTEAIDLVARAFTRNDGSAVDPVRARRGDDPLAVQARVRTDGVAIDGSGGTLVPGCESVGSGPTTVPDRMRDIDAVALVDCTEKIRRDFPDEHDLHVGADDHVSTLRFARAVAALVGPARARRWDPVIATPAPLYRPWSANTTDSTAAAGEGRGPDGTGVLPGR